MFKVSMSFGIGCLKFATVSTWQDLNNCSVSKEWVCAAVALGTSVE